MISVSDFSDAELFNDDSTEKNIVITIQGEAETITNSELTDQGLSLIENLCSGDQLQFGSCEASELSLSIAVDAVPYSLEGKKITVQIYLNGHSSNKLTLGTYKVASDTKDTITDERNIRGYDVLKDILDATDIRSWYDSLLPTDQSTTTLASMRNSFFSHFGITQEAVTLVNDSMPISKTWAGELPAGYVIKCICEANGVFGHITRDNKFRYVELIDQTLPLYPAEDLCPADTLYPSDGNSRVIVPGDEKSGWLSGDFENYSVAKIDQLDILLEDGSAGETVGSGTNVYTVTDNFLFWNLSAADLTTYATNLFNKIKNVTYVPYSIELLGDPCFEAGDGIIAQTYNGSIYSYIFQRTLTGIQTLTDAYGAIGSGENYQSESTSLRSEVSRLRNKGNILKRTVDETVSEIFDQNHTSRITQNANSIAAEVTNRQNADTALGFRIDGINNTLSLYVKFDEDYSGIVISKNKVHIKSTGTFQVDAGNLQIDAAGNVSMTGEITAKSGKIGPFEINETSGLYYNTKRILFRPQLGGIGLQSWDGDLSINSINGALSISSGYNHTWLNINMSDKVTITGDTELHGDVYVTGDFDCSDGTATMEKLYDLSQTKTIAWTQLQNIQPTDYVLKGT